MFFFQPDSLFLCLYILIFLQFTTCTTSQEMYKRIKFALQAEEHKSESIFAADEGHLRNDRSIDSNLPPTWQDFCTLKGTENNGTLLSYECSIDGFSSGRWNFSQLRDYISAKHFKYAFDVQCRNNSNISFPFNGKARNIVKLHVRDCIATDYYSDFQNADLDKIPDELEEVVLINVQRVISVKAMMKNLQIKPENIPRNVNCGDEDTLKVKIERNESYSFVGNLPNISTFITIASSNIINKRISSQKCSFKNLQLLETSAQSSRSRYFAEFLTESNRFPELRTLNISHSSLYYVPEQFKNWMIYFPKLEYLDMSHNKIQDIVLPVPKDYDPTSARLTLDLTFNDIRQISVRFLEKIVLARHLYVIIDNNPINCSCKDQMRDVLKYIRDTDWNSVKYERHQYIRDLKCQFPENIKGRRLRDLTDNDIGCGFKILPIIVVLSILICFLLIFLFLIIRSRLQIRLFCAQRLSGISSDNSIDMDAEKSFKFDALICHGLFDEEWARSTFIENRHKLLSHLKLCFHREDATDQKNNFEKLIDQMKSSKYVVVLLSRQFLEGEFLTPGFQEALQQSNEHRTKKRSILVLMDDIPTQEETICLRRSLQTFTCIHKNDTRFTDKFLYLLSSKGDLAWCEYNEGNRQQYVAI